MKGDMPQAAIRLCTVLPVRTHRAPEPQERNLARPPNLPVRRGAVGKPIRVAGVVYPNLREAKRRLRKGAKTIQEWLDTRVAEYV